MRTALAARTVWLPMDVFVVGVLLAAYGNAASIALAQAAPSGGWTGVLLGTLPAMATLVWAKRAAALSADELGLYWRAAPRAAAVGLLVGVAIALPSIVLLYAPPLIGRPVTHAPLNSLSPESLLWRAFVWMPLDTALPEELAFRGVLLGALLRRFGSIQAVLISAAAFTLWHVVIVARTLGVTNLAEEQIFLAIGLAGSFVSVFVGGVVFAVLRLKTGHVSASVMAHWSFNALLLLALYAPG